MGGDGGGGSPTQTGADGAPADQHGTQRDFGNMLNAYMGKKKKHSKNFNPWVHIKMGGVK